MWFKFTGTWSKSRCTEGRLAHLLVLGLLISGCDVASRLDAPLIIRADTPATDCAGLPLPIGPRHFGDFLIGAVGTLAPSVPTTEFASPANCDGTTARLDPGLALRPGDVIEIASFTPGGPTDQQYYERAQTPPLLAPTLLLPLRRVATARTYPPEPGPAAGQPGDGPHLRLQPRQVLEPTEERLLAAALSAQRAPAMVNLTGTEQGVMRRAFAEHQPELWNALLPALRVKRVMVRHVPGSEPTRPVLVLALDRSAWCIAFERETSTLAAPQMLRRWLGGTPDRCPSGTAVSDILGGNPTHAGPAGAVVPSAVSNAHGAYGDQIGRHLAFATTVRLRRDAVRLADRDGGAADWSLAAWEESGLCAGADGAPRRIERVQIRDGSSLRLAADNDSRFTHRVRVVLTQSLATRAIARCSTERDGPRCETGSWLAARLPREDLHALTPRDLADIAWDRPAPTGRDRCGL